MTGNQTSALETPHIESKGHRAGELVLLEACLLLVAANSYYYSIFVCTHAEKSLRCCYVSQIRCTSLCPSSNATAVCTKFSHQASARRPFHQYHRIPTSTGNEIPSILAPLGHIACPRHPSAISVAQPLVLGQLHYLVRYSCG